MILRIYGLVLRHLYLYRRSVARSMELFFWPVMDLLVWGFVMRFLETVSLPGAVTFLLGAMILWDVLYRSQQAITLAMCEEIWVRNVLNLFVAPIRTCELSIATSIMGLIKGVLTVTILGLLAWAIHGYDVLRVGPALVPFIGCLVLFGWSLGMITAALMIRFGHAAEALTWGIPFLVQPLSAVFYPLATLPAWVQGISWCLPSTHIFEGLRYALATGCTDGHRLALALGLNLAHLLFAALFFGWMVRQAREKGYLSRLGME